MDAFFTITFVHENNASLFFKVTTRQYWLKKIRPIHKCLTRAIGVLIKHYKQELMVSIAGLKVFGLLECSVNGANPGQSICLRAAMGDVPGSSAAFFIFWLRFNYSIRRFGKLIAAPIGLVVIT